MDIQARTAKLSSKEEVEFDKALIATGANVRRLNVEGCELEQIHYLRTLGNADAIREGVADARERGPDRRLLHRLRGRCLADDDGQALHDRDAGGDTRSNEASARTPGSFFQRLLEEHGVTVHGGDELERFEGEGRVGTVITRGGLELAADAVVVGAGVTPDIALAQQAGLEIGERGGVRCDSRLQSSAPGIYAAGDICEYESIIHGGEPVRIEHWDVAFNHGKTAALNMLGRDWPTRRCPTSSQCSATGANWSTSVRPMSGRRRSSAARSPTAASPTGTSRTTSSRPRSRSDARTISITPGG